MRWPKHSRLLDQKGNLRKTYLFLVGRKARSSKKFWNPKKKCYQKYPMLYMTVQHPQIPEQKLYLIISRWQKGKRPWYLLTNQRIDNPPKAWKLIQAYQRRWQIEMSFRFNKSELKMDSPRLWKWENRLKFLAILALVYDFLLSLLRSPNPRFKKQILRMGCHRTGKKLQKTEAPIYRIRSASILLYLYQGLQSLG